MGFPGHSAVHHHVCPVHRSSCILQTIKARSRHLQRHWIIHFCSCLGSDFLFLATYNGNLISTSTPSWFSFFRDLPTSAVMETKWREKASEVCTIPYSSTTLAFRLPRMIICLFRLPATWHSSTTSLLASLNWIVWWKSLLIAAQR